jgi:hypothetical protein
VKIGLAIEQVGRSEAELARQLVSVGARHKSDHDVFHVTRTLAKMEQGHVDSLSDVAAAYGVSLVRSQDDSPGPAEPILKIAEKAAELVGRRPEPALLLLRDLRSIYLMASEVSINWVMLAQGAQAVKDTDLLAIVSACHGQTLRTIKWSTYRIKSAAPQILAT